MPLSFSDLPPEIILSIADFLDYQSEINALSQCGHSLYELLNPVFYSNDARFTNSYALRWAAWRGVEAMALKALQFLEPRTKPENKVLALAALYGHGNLVDLFCKLGLDLEKNEAGLDEFA
ncbi:hypothetical protein BJY01DRAFT_250123 [Aspergillus pseudoustus]|uniref:F-box domain-containing protein n=1 Tax=Aspergillus pseudoustus TaxID=1810923 RepID=A0ABR4JMK6_9EURO